MEITKKFKDALSRQANEAVRIFNRSSDQLLNSKAEFNHPPLARVVVEKKITLGFDKKRKYPTVNKFHSSTEDDIQVRNGGPFIRSNSSEQETLS